jgi:integrase
MTDEIRKILTELKEKQTKLNIKSEWVFAKENGDWITTASYYEALNKICKKLNLKLSNNHAFRMALNSYVYIPMGLPVTERAKLLGHSVETNLKFYTFARTDDYLAELSEKMNAYNSRNRANSGFMEGSTQGTQNIISFKAKEKSLESATTQAFL